MFGYVYKTTCLITGLIYIGQHRASKFEPRKYIGSGSKLKAEIKKYGKENFICEFICEASTLEELSKLEKQWIIKLDSTNPAIGYNILKYATNNSTGLRKVICGKQSIYIYAEQLESYLTQGWALSTENYDKIYYEANKEQIKQKRALYRKSEGYKIYKEKSKLKRQAWHNEYYNSHKQQLDEAYKTWLSENKEKRKEYLKKYRQKHPEVYEKAKLKYALKKKLQKLL